MRRLALCLRCGGVHGTNETGNSERCAAMLADREGYQFALEKPLLLQWIRVDART
jgi:hypothetical protein